MKIVNDSPNDNIFIALMDYRVDYECDELKSPYGFGFFHMHDSLISHINIYLDEKRIGFPGADGIFIEIFDFFLLDAEYIFEQTRFINDPNKKSDYDGIKLDSINFIEDKPSFPEPIITRAVGKIVLKPKEFYIEAEDLAPYGISVTIYRSAVKSYWNLNHLLNRPKPI